MGRTQGDRLLAMKVKAQHHLGTAKFTSPTTPVKPVVISQSKPAGNHARRLLHCTVEHIPQPAPISRVTVSSTCGRPAVVKSKSSKRLVGYRISPAMWVTHVYLAVSVISGTAEAASWDLVHMIYTKQILPVPSFTVRSKPYPPAGVKIQMPPSGYELRPRHSFNASQLRDLAKTLPPNSDALIGVCVPRAAALSPAIVPVRVSALTLALEFIAAKKKLPSCRFTRSVFAFSNVRR
uniref:Uncharacterized protein n=1 Tax=Ascaris lumbricoides TaxID=6252 RepID=A0A9J2Q9G0_ASCLU